MAFANTGSLVAADANNMLRGLYRDHTAHTHTGTTDEADLASVSITAGTIGATGGLYVVAAGTITNSAGGQKSINFYLGPTAIATISRTGANAQDWMLTAWMFNTAANAQRWLVTYSTTDAATVTTDYVTSAVDTSSNQTLKLTGDISSTADTIVQTMFSVFVVQIT